MQLRRDWRERFERARQEAEAAPADDARHNCALWAAHVVCEVTGEQLAADYIGKSRAEQDALLAAEGGLRGALRARGLPRIPVGRARRADVVLVRTADGLAAGVADPPYILGVGEAGLDRWPMAAGVAAYRLGVR